MFAKFSALKGLRYYSATVGEKLEEVKFGHDIRYCEECMRANSHKYAYKEVRKRNEISSARLHTGVKVRLPRGIRVGTRYIVTFTGDYSTSAHNYVQNAKRDRIYARKCREKSVMQGSQRKNFVLYRQISDRVDRKSTSKLAVKIIWRHYVVKQTRLAVFFWSFPH